ncbi:transcriptional regulator, TetR family [Paraburkholderia phytofirmans PsJN]|uniref:Transcriptional regulator, TetR family n=1 Tax=Paraburkholderia phytofirmans (strain DSM 17436 / LMG 22146 / PsJN) TaxID=398527 RepID=B2T5E3_PARPJ|nr:transcriptional regulator, TetR family [Paraburkholderia phytofirmans PsJN]
MRRKNASVSQPRKSPRQARSASTLETVLEATVQVILLDGPKKLTTTRVAYRAGFSVGTVYQYYANKDSLLYAVVQRHLQRVANAVEAACLGLHRCSLDRMVAGFVDSFFTASTAQNLEARAFYLVWPELDTGELVQETYRRLESATVAMLASSSRLEGEQLPVVAFMLTSTLLGSTRLAFEQHASDHLMQLLRKQLTTMCGAYVSSIASGQSALNKCGNETGVSAAAPEEVSIDVRASS